MSQKVPVNGFNWVEDLSEFNESFIKSYNEENDEGYFLEVDVQYPEKYIIFKMIYCFSLKELKLKKIEKLVVNLHDKTEYVIDIKNFEKTLNHGLVSKIFHKVIKFNQEPWRKPYNDMITEIKRS